jgi:hypothetical protein
MPAQLNDRLRWRRIAVCGLPLLLLPSLSVCAPGAQEGDFQFRIVDAGALITSYIGPGGSVAIPDHLGGVAVTSIGYRAFAGSSLISVTIPNSVGYIGDVAFSRCTSLMSVMIPNSVTNIGGMAFSGCVGLTSVTIPNSLTAIGYSAFSDCTSLTSATIPNSVTAIEDYAFFGCTSLTSATIPNSVTTIGYSAFRGCTSLTSVTIPSSVTSIGGGAFDGCTSLTSLAMDNSVATIGDYAFSECTSLISAMIGNSVTGIGDYAFSSCRSLTSVTIPDSVTTVGGSAFSDCASLTSVTIPNAVTAIRDYTFSGCTSLTSATIPNSVTAIGYSAFSRCISLTSATIPNSVTIIGTLAFSGCTSLAGAKIGDSVTSIGVLAFFGCTGLTTITVAELNPTYSSEAGVLFDKTRSTLIECPAGKAGPYAIPNSVTTVRDWAFSGCTSLTSVAIPSSVTAIGHSGFAGCTSLTSAYFEGNAPNTGFLGLLFDGSPFVTVFFRAGATGWGSTFEGRPTAVWELRPSYSEWAVSSGLTAQFPNASAEGDDPDGDLLSNHDEWLAGTDPTQRASVLALELEPRPADLASNDRIPVPGGHRAVYFQSVPGRYYGVQSTALIPGLWSLVDVRVASATQTRFVVQKPPTSAFYRVVLLP